jgi:hypothetical protein
VTVALRDPGTWLDRAAAAPASTAVLIASPLVAIANGRESIWLILVAAVLALVVIPNPGLRLSPWPWLAAAIACLAWDRLHWWGIDDHVVVTHYWLLAIGCSLFAADPERSLDLNARLLIGLTFTFAVTSKLLWGEVLDGSFYRGILLIDERFIWLARAAGIEDPTNNHAILERAHDLGAVTLDGGERSRSVAAVMTAGTLLIEGSVAVTFLAPLRGAWRQLRTWSLAVFCLVTYALVPVTGFGSLLLVMASAERRHDGRARLAHYAGVLALVVWTYTWAALH